MARTSSVRSEYLRNRRESVNCSVKVLLGAGRTGRSP